VQISTVYVCRERESHPVEASQQGESRDKCMTRGRGVFGRKTDTSTKEYSTYHIRHTEG
jgi:hypothetical protein